MATNSLGAFAEGFRDALRLFVAMIAAPLAVLSSFTRHGLGKSHHGGTTHPC